MLIYNLLLVFLVVLGILLCEWGKNKLGGKSANIAFLCAASAAMILISSLRANTVGIDYKMYSDYFSQVRSGGWAFLISSANGYRIEPGYSLLNYLVSLFTPDVRVFMAVVAILMVTLTAVLAYKFSPIPWVSIFVFASFGFFGNTLSFIRQSIAITIFLFAIPYLKQKKFVPYLLIVLLAATFHKSIIIMIAAYWLAHIRVTWKSIAVYLAGMVVVMAASWPIISFLATHFFPYYATQEGLYYVVLGRDWNTAFIPVVTAAVAVILMKPLLKRDPSNVVLINLALFGAILYIMTCQRFLFQRIAMMFYATAILFIPEMLRSVGVDNENAEEYMQLKQQARKGTGANKKKAYEESRKLKTQMNVHKYVYYYSLAAVIFFGFLYNAFLLLANRINLNPYASFVHFG